MLCLRDGNRDGYRKVCADMLRRFAKADDPGSVHWLTRTCVLAPDAVADAAQVVQRAEKAVAKEPKNLRYLNTLGAALYRAGRFEDAVKRLTEASASRPNEQEMTMPSTWYFLALTHHRLGHADEARRWLDKADQATEEALTPPAGPSEKSGNTTGPVPPPWNRGLALQLLRREAEEQIRGPRAKPSK
jgi:tetratricopeptide (TPR) repeat protein